MLNKLAVDTFYRSPNEAYTVGILFERWTDKTPLSIFSCTTTKFGPYIPGQFYKRELPCILDLLKQIDLTTLDTIIVDGYVSLGENHPGLGLKLSEYIPGKIEIIGVAKTEYKGAPSCKIIRGKHGTTKPLYIQANKMNNELAGSIIKMMDGEYRIPTLLKILDKETKLPTK